MIDFEQLARESGFDTVAPLDPASLEFLPEVRSMCAADRCQSFGKTWSCPPGCGTLEECRDRCSKYTKGLLLQTIGDREDSYDFEAMMEAAELNKEQVEAFAKKLYAANADFLIMAAGTCTRCQKCTYPDEPCRFPDLCFPSMEACGLFVSKVCTDNGIPYNYGDEKIAYTCCVLFE